MTTPGERIRALREALRREGAPVTQVDLAEDVEVALRTVQSWEADERAPSGENLVRLARALGTTPGYITDGRPLDVRVSGKERDRMERLVVARYLRQFADELERASTLPPESSEAVEIGERGRDAVNQATAAVNKPAGKRKRAGGRGGQQ